MDNYERLIERISTSASLAKDEIERKVEAKRAKLSGLVSKEGAAQIVAAELGINFDQERMKISELVHGMRRANFIGKVLQIFPVREFEKSGRKGKVANLRVADDTSNCKVVLWDTNHISLIEQGKIKEGEIIEVSNGGVRNGEVHLGGFSELKKSKEKLEGVVEGRIYLNKKLNEANSGESLKVRAFVVQAFEPRYFEVNAKTGRKLTEEEKAQGAETEKKALLNLVLDDGSETIRAVLFGKDLYKLGLKDDEIFDLEKFNAVKNKLLGEERIFSGSIRDNQVMGFTEFSLDGIEEIKPDELVKELEAKTG